MRALLCGGGTAGHVIPAIAIGEIIERNFPNSEIAYAGRRGGDENKAYRKTGRKLYEVDVRGLQRSLSINNIKTVFKMIKSSRNAREIIKEFKPDVIIGTGGYVCYPFLRQGQRLGVKTLLHESNVSPGLVTRMLCRKCDKVMLNLEGTKAYLKSTKNSVAVGNPTLTDFGVMSKTEARARIGVKENEILIVSFGGSLGADILNKTVGEMINKYTSKNKRIRHIHSTGRSNFEKMKKEFPELFRSSYNVKILPYIDNMPTLLTACDLAITRSGAMTVSELCRSGAASILIPSPNVTANHQYVNAAYMRDTGAALLIEESELTAKKLYEETASLIGSQKRMKEMSENALSAAKRDTEELIVKTLRDVLTP